jgi:endonuclease/exonuclease/phosphatase family metal-dependent hydrolase
MKRFNRIKIFFITAFFSIIFISCHILKNESIVISTDKNKSVYDKNNQIKGAFDSLVFAFYNVENLYDTIDDPNTEDEEFTPQSEKQWTSERYNKKLADLAWVLSHMNNTFPAVIGLGEVENRAVVEELIKTGDMKNANYSIVHEESPDTRGIDVAFLYRKDVFDYISHESIPVVLPSDTAAKLRNILYVKMKLENDTFHIFVNHWKSRQPSTETTEIKRIETAQILREYVDKILYLNKNSNIIIMGDFNDEPTSKSLYEVLYATDNELNPKYIELFNLMYKKALNGEGTLSRDYKWYMLDNLIVSQSLVDNLKYHVVKKEGYVFKDDRILFYNSKAGFKIPNKTYGGKSYYGGFSDHLPVYFILKK